MRRLLRQVKLALGLGRAYDGCCVKSVGGGGNDILGIGAPFSIDDFDGDQTRQALLLAATVQSRKFGADRDGRSWNWISDIGTRAGNSSVDGLKVVFKSAVV